MKKAVKIILWILAVIIVVPLVLVLTLPLWLGTIARPAVNAVAPSWTQTEFNIGHLSLNPYTGRLEVGDLVVGNPKGYNEPTAVSISNLVFDVNMSTLGDKYIHVEEVVVENLYLSYFKGGENNVENILQIQYNLAGGKEQYELNVAKDKAKKEALEAKLKAEEAKLTQEERDRRDEEKAAAEKKFVIDHLVIRGVRLKYGLITIPLPMDIELRDLGKETEGVNFTEFFDTILQAIIKAAISTGDAAKALGEGISNAAKGLTEGLTTGGGAAAEAAKGAVEGAGKVLQNMFNYK